MKKIFYFVLFTSVLVQSYAQTLEYSWARQAGGKDTDTGNAIATDLNGNVIVSGTFTGDSVSFGNITLTNPDSFSVAMFVAKYDSGGNLLWAKNPTTPTAYKTTNGVGVATDANGNVFVAGDMNTDSINFDGNWFVFDNASYSYLAKYDPNGNFVWLKKAFGAYGTAGVAVDGNGDVLLTAKNALAFDGTLLTNDGTGKQFVAKYSNSGNFMWANFATFSVASSYGFNAEWDSKTVFTDAGNNVYMAGWSGLDTTFFNDDKTIYVANNVSLRNSFLVKYNTNGVALWAKGADKGITPNSLSYITPEGIHTSDNFVYLTGWWNGDSLRFDNNQITATSYQNMFVAKFDMSGNNLWVRSLGSEGNDYSQGLALDSAENVYLAGTTEGENLHYNNDSIGTTIGGNHASIFKINPNGNFVEYIQSNNIPFYGTSFGNAIAIDGSDNIFMTGGFMSEVAFGKDTLTSTNLWQDMFVCKVFNDYSVGISPFEPVNNFKIYPNPASKSISIELGGEKAAKETEIGIYSLTGNLVKKEKYQENLIMIDIEELVNGVYILSVSSTGTVERQKLLIRK
ncbi:MAG: SBBP repeat-containing protein [Bacteroidia bacterium]|nr:SBBP repeat-containing protein [Bacteroidia bacterium]